MVVLMLDARPLIHDNKRASLTAATPPSPLGPFLGNGPANTFALHWFSRDAIAWPANCAGMCTASG